MVANEGSLADSFRRLIAMNGPISLMQFMGESNARYYADANPLGSEGDFITAPEISQMFGELIGLWLADLWIRAGQSSPVHFVELGPGRGFLARDAYRAMNRYGLTPQMHLVEGSPQMRALQGHKVPDAVFHDDLTTVPTDGPILLVANEFLDALPVRQLVKTGAGWREVMVNVADEKFVLVAGNMPMDAAVPDDYASAEVGTVIETCPGAAAVMSEVADRLAKQGGTALFIDYGHVKPRTGSTVQAVRAHEKVKPLDTPGEADLTAHVDFDQMKTIAQMHGAKWLGTTTQGEWLAAVGINERADALAEFAPQHRDALFASRDRLIKADEMGELFKIMGLLGPDWPDGAGFAPAE